MTHSRPLALVTGASGGIGREIAAALAPDFDLVLTGRDPDRLAELTNAFPGARGIVLDLERPGTFEAAVAGLGRLDALVHNAGVVELGRVGETPHGTWTHTLAVNLVAPAELTRALLLALRAARGHVVFVNSGAGLAASPGWGSYAASKFGLRALADALRAEEAPRVRVTTVYPGRTATGMQRKVRAQEHAPYDEEAYIRPASVARAVAQVLAMPRDAVLTDVTVRPGG